MATRRQVLQFLGACIAGVGTAREDGLELLAVAHAQSEDRPTTEPLEQQPEEEQQSEEPTVYDLFQPALEQAFPGRPMHRLYEKGYTHDTKQPGDLYVIIGSDRSFLVKSVDIYKSGPFGNVLIDTSILSVDDNQDATYTVTTGASYTNTTSDTVEADGISKGSGGSCYASATGKKEDIPNLVMAVKAWQEVYDSIFQDAKMIFHATDSPQTIQQRLESILQLYQERFPRLADPQQWLGLSISPEAQTVLRNLGTTYDLDDVAQSLMGK